ncbi:MAG: hypothetical protein F6K65_33220 [Moorea sp. SIO3C2]|nr:hypothetical protein [Moorena sp. SIO3C2]
MVPWNYPMSMAAWKIAPALNDAMLGFVF